MYIPGDKKGTRVLREGLARRALLMLALLLRSISPAVRRRYPTLQSLVEEGTTFFIFETLIIIYMDPFHLGTGVMTRMEKQCYESISPVVNLFWVINLKQKNIVHK